MNQQELMDKAYSRWENQNWSKRQFWNQLSFVEKVAVFTGNLNYQVENGGFMQWIDNAYSDCHIDLVDILENHIKTETVLQVVWMVNTAISRSENDDYECEFCRYGCECDEGCYLGEEYDCNCGCECSYPDYDDLDTKFYQINEQFLKDVQEWLDKQES